MLRTSRFTRPAFQTSLAALLLGLLTAAGAQADEAQQAVVAVRLKVVSACTVAHGASVDVHCTPDTPMPAIVHAGAGTLAPAQASTAQSDAQTGATRVDIVF